MNTGREDLRSEDEPDRVFQVCVVLGTPEMIAELVVEIRCFVNVLNTLGGVTSCWPVISAGYIGTGLACGDIIVYVK